ncbi:unnamed protein product [Symbiodinium natans]|uniref:Uncharacterized protein n=1 Tax=Symbiodinium natans TaxID=878477 RepID=A0A812GH79_9DINO|nr:unnamed protein product [Symbiodinium natans]
MNIGSQRQKMMRQRELVLKRQTEAAKSFGVRPRADAPKCTAALHHLHRVLSARGPPEAPRVGIAAAEVQAEPEEQTAADECQQAHSLEYSLEEVLLASGQAIEREAEDRGPDHLGHGWDLDVQKGSGDALLPCKGVSDRAQVRTTESPAARGASGDPGKRSTVPCSACQLVFGSSLKPQFHVPGRNKVKQTLGCRLVDVLDEAMLPTWRRAPVHVLAALAQ